MLAIIIPYFKRTFFEATLASLAAQTCQDFKVYIGDDASPEDPSNLIEKYKGQFDFSYHRFEDNLGGTSLTKQWERCIALSSNEEWLMILGDDDVLGKNCLASFYENINKLSNINVVRFVTCKIDDNGGLNGDLQINEELDNAKSIIFNNKRSSLSEYILRKVTINKIGFKDFPLAWFSDVLAVLEFSNFSTIFSIKNAIVYIRVSSISISGSNTNYRKKSEGGFQFYYYLLKSKRSYFTYKEQIQLQEKLIKSYLNNKKNILFFFKTSLLILFNSNLKHYFLFLIAIVKNILFKQMPHANRQ